MSSLLEVGTGFHPELTGRENVFLNGAILGMFRAEILRKFDAIVAFAELEQFIDTPVKHYSSGMYVRLAFSVAAHLEPEILIVDEVLSVGDLHFRNKCLGRMQDLRGEGRTVLFVSHDLTSIRQLCTRALLLNGGRVVDDGTPAEITRRYERHVPGATPRTAPAPPIACRRRRDYHLRRVELRNAAGAPSGVFDAGDVMEIHLWSSGPAPENSFTAEFKLLNDDDEIVSFGAANPVRDTYYRSEHQHFVCRLGPLPLTEGAYTFSFTVRVWNKERWDYWDKAIGFTIGRCDLFNTGHGIANDQQRRLRDPAGMADRRADIAGTMADATDAAAAPLVSINIPCYHQLAAARRCVEAMLAQTLERHRDHAARRRRVGRVPRLWSRRSATRGCATTATRSRLGAMRNMFQAITAGRGTYTIAFHEDDLLGAHYLATAVGDPRSAIRRAGSSAASCASSRTSRRADVLDCGRRNPADRAVRVAGRLPAGDLPRRRADVRIDRLSARRRSRRCRGARAFATLVDRPFLMSILRPLVGGDHPRSAGLVRQHGEGDVAPPGDEHRPHPRGCSRSTARRCRRRSSADDRALFYAYSGYWLFTLYRLTPPAERGAVAAIRAPRVAGRSVQSAVVGGLRPKAADPLMLTGR